MLPVRLRARGSAIIASVYFSLTEGTIYDILSIRVKKPPFAVLPSCPLSNTISG
jgi:hypothetical protein